MVVTVSHLGYIKRNPITEYRAQHRGGKGVKGMEAREEDFVERLFIASTHAYILFFTTRGRAHWLKVHELPQLGRAARGKSLANVLALAEGERVRATLPVRAFDEEAEDAYVLLCAQGRGQEDATRRLLEPAPRRDHRDHARRRRRADRREPYQRPPRGDPRDQRRQVDPLPGRSGACDGPRCGRRARHVAARG
jgi:hypothetical protein